MNEKNRITFFCRVFSVFVSLHFFFLQARNSPNPQRIFSPGECGDNENKFCPQISFSNMEREKSN